MKISTKHRSGTESYSLGEAAEVLGLSIPTIKWMVAKGQLESFRTPGGHFRILAESIEAVREHRQTPRENGRYPSPVLQNRRERLEELTLEAQETRARRELDRLRRDEQEEAEGREAEAEAREQAAAQREAELELERERLEYERAQEQARQKREQAYDRQRRETEQQLAAFRCQWLDKANETVSAYEYRWLSASQRKEILEGWKPKSRSGNL